MASKLEDIGNFECVFPFYIGEYEFNTCTNYISKSKRIYQCAMKSNPTNMESELGNCVNNGGCISMNIFLI